MSNSLDKPQKSQSLAVKKPILPEIATIALSSESYWQRVRKSIRVQTGEYIKKDLIYSLIAAAVLGVPTLLAGKATLTAFILGVIGFLVTFVVRGLKHSIETLELFDRAIKGELGECENRFNELTKDKLQLEIDLRDSKVCLDQTKSALRIFGGNDKV
ncbi:MAG TPA: hypothetical protein VN843_35610 [Anaerolineales bacterium]|nr:hypothetical protein [Anaerolineales bacterium]